MYLTEQILIKPKHPMFDYCSDITHKTKNLYNAANYSIRQALFNSEQFNLKLIPNYTILNTLMYETEEYKYLPAQTAQQTLKILAQDWTSFKRLYFLNKAGKVDKPSLPKYKKKDGHTIAIFTNQQVKIKDGYLHFPKTDLKLKTRLPNNTCLKQVRIIPQATAFKVEIVREVNQAHQPSQTTGIIAIDLGINNLVTITNNKGLQPLVINGKIIKSINQYYNKELAKLKSQAKLCNNKYTTKRIQLLTERRNRKINDQLHKISKAILRYALTIDCYTIILGYNQGWKQSIKLGSKTNQRFVSIPFYKLKSMLEYKCQKYGFNFIQVTEEYTSGCSFLDSEPLHPAYYNKSRRITRGLFLSNKKTLINADVNASYNILKKAIPNAFQANGIEDVVLHPKVLSIA